MTYRDTEFTALWQAVFSVTATVQEETDSGRQPLDGAVVELWYGSSLIERGVTSSGGSITFANLVPGTYNLAVSQGQRIVTTKVIITDQDKECDAVLPQYSTNSIVNVSQGSPAVIVGNLEQVFNQEEYDQVYTQADAEKAQNGARVDITLSAEKRDPSLEASDQQLQNDMELIENDAPSNMSVGLVMDYSLTKTVTESGQQPVSTQLSYSNVLLELIVPIPVQLQGMDVYYVYRSHSDGGSSQAQRLTENPEQGQEGFVVSQDGKYITIYADKFSTYVLGYANIPVAPGTQNRPTVNQSGHGTVSVSPLYPVTGGTVTVTATPEERYHVGEIVVTDGDGNPVELTDLGGGEYTFTQPQGAVTITVAFVKSSPTAQCPRDESCPMSEYSDLPMDAWYHDGVHYCLDAGLMEGFGGGIFSPELDTSRAMLVTILWRIEGQPQAEYSGDYSDVTSANWFAQAIGWATQQGIVNGYDNGKFGPNDTVTRQQMVTILYRYCQYKGRDISAGDDTNILSYLDAASISEYAVPAMQWACGCGLVDGVGQGLLDPRGATTRAQAATLIMRFLEMI